MNQELGIISHARRNLAIATSIFVVVIIALVSASVVAMVASAADAAFPGVAIADLPVGGLTRDQIRKVLRERIDVILDRGFTFSADGRSAFILGTTFAPGDPDLIRERLTFNEERMADAAVGLGHEGALPRRVVEFLRLRLSGGVSIPFDFTVNEEAISADIRSAFQDLEKSKREPGFSVDSTNGAIKFQAVPGANGTTIDTATAIARLKRALAAGTPATIEVPVRRNDTELSYEDVESLIPAASRIIAAFPATGTLRYDNHSWTITREAVAGWLAVAATPDRPTLAFSSERLDPFFDDLAKEIETSARDAKFRLEGKRVIEFQASREGVHIDRDATREALEIAWIAGGDPKAVEIVVQKTAPKVAVSDLNSLGIKEVLGVGTSNFSGSPGNRVKNIRNGITKLNGTLIAPDEEFSLLEPLRPFTAEGGYLPELVIKGDRIIPELGGGLCQIGTTAFRMAMNAGMKITMRQNHSIVVRYYNDPKNKNPGTDATIYDPAPDFKFINDTGRYLLITTEMNTATGNLAFTLWGTSDGRKGTYDAPVVTKWYPAGEDKEIPTTELKPGERKCQEKHPGADAVFTYTRTLADGTEENKVYTSHYRSLPKICLVGVNPDQMPVAGAPPATNQTSDSSATDAGAPAT